jgi:WD40 repeat protein
MDAPNYVNFICARGDELNYNGAGGFIACADNSIHVFAVGPVVEDDHAHEEDKERLAISHLQSIECHSKIVNQCCMVDQHKVITCSREPIVKLFDLNGGSEPIAQFKGHEMPVSAVSYRAGKIATGGRDCTTRVWDIETQKTVSKRKIDRNLVT